VVELADRITGGLDASGHPMQLPKVYLGMKPKMVLGVTAKQWCGRKQHKINLVKELAKKAGVQLWDGRSKDINGQAWKHMKQRYGILRPHMDELLRRVGDQYLHKLTRRGEQPRSDAPVCPTEFSDEVFRVLSREPIIDVTKQTAFAFCTMVEEGQKMVLNKFGEFCIDGRQSPYVVQFPSDSSNFAGGLIDLRYVRPYWMDPLPEEKEAKNYVPYSNLLEPFGDIINEVPFWMVITGNLSAGLANEMMEYYFNEFVKIESDYVPAKGEIAFLTKKQILEHNGVKIYILES
jgi:hypothetical protein